MHYVNKKELTKSHGVVPIADIFLNKNVGLADLHPDRGHDEAWTFLDCEVAFLCDKVPR